MYLIHYSKSFKRDFKKLLKSGKFKNLNNDLKRIIILLQSDKKLDPTYKDHKLRGEFEGYRELHIRPNLLIVYKIEKNKMILLLVEIGAHSYLF